MTQITVNHYIGSHFAVKLIQAHRPEQSSAYRVQLISLTGEFSKDDREYTTSNLGYARRRFSELVKTAVFAEQAMLGVSPGEIDTLQQGYTEQWELEDQTTGAMVREALAAQIASM